MLNRKFAMALAAVMVLAVLYGCSSSDSGLKSDLRDAEADVTELQDKLDALAMALGVEGDPTAADIQAAIESAETAELMEVADALGLTPAGDTRQDLVDAINAHVDTAAGPVHAFTAAQTAKTAAEAAVAAVKSATEKMAELGALEVDGESMTAKANAQAILDAETTRDTSLATAATELANAEGVVDEDAAEDDALNNALKAAIAAAKVELDAANEKAQGDMMKAAVDAVTGGAKADPQGTPESIGRAVAMEVGMALMPESATDPSRSARAPHGTTAPADTVMNSVVMDNHTGMTWAEIVGDANLVDKRIVEGTITKAVKASSVDGMTLTNDQTAGDIADGTQDGATYKGIEGMVFCNGSDCEVEDVADDNTVRKLVGSWYFTPTNADWYYEKVGTATTYTRETNFAQYGYWLTETTGDTPVIVVNTFALGGADTDTNTSNLALNVNEAIDATTLTDREATYNGSAVGMSLHKEVDGNNQVTSIYSGAFTATVELTAKFGATPTLSGMIDRFVGDGADPRWEVTLKESAWTAASLAADSVTSADGGDGEWTAQGYGTDGARPTGVYGGFSAHFSDGHAAGAYAAE